MSLVVDDLNWFYSYERVVSAPNVCNFKESVVIYACASPM